MAHGRSESVAALVVAATALLATCIFGFLSFTPGVPPDVGGFLQMAFFGATIVAVGAFGAYAFLARGGARFERSLERRRAAMAAVPVGLIAVGVGGCWYILKSMGAGPAVPGAAAFGSIDTLGIVAFLGFGTLYVVAATWTAIRAERAAIQAARADAEVSE